MSTSPSQSFQCRHCVLIFKSKFFLLEHVSKVHGLSVDTELPSLKTNTPSSNLNVVDKHEKTFHQKSTKKVEPLQIQKRYLKGKLHIIRRPGIQLVATSNKTKKNAVNKMSRPQHEDETGAKVNSSTSKANCLSSSSMGLKTYKRPSGPITKFLVPSSSVSMVKYSSTSVKLPDHPKLSGISKETLILHNPHLSTAQDSTGVLKVTATSQNDLCVRNSVHTRESACIVNDLFVREHLMVGSLVQGSVSTEIGKKAREEISVSPPKKRLKIDVGLTKSLESTAVEAKLSCSSNFAFEVSEDEDAGDNLIHELDGKVDVVNVDNSLMYSCKHCRHGDMVADDVLTHYEKVHPYIRCSSAYIMDPLDRTARFRCLECPVEYPYVADLRLHYRVSHPGASDVFQMQSHELCFKCFVCPFTTLLSESLKDHYQKEHPSHIVINPLIYCTFNASICRKEMSQANTCEKKSFPKTPDQGSLKSATTPDKEMPPVEMSQDNTCEKKSIPKTPDQGSLKSATTPDKEMPPVEMSQVNTCEKTPSPKSADQGSFNSAATLLKNSEATPPQKEPSSQGVDRELHQCKNCTFTHMSAVAMLVHYQRHHPERGMSIDEIKMAHVKSQTQAPLSPERNSKSSATVSSMNKSPVSPQTRISDSLKEAKDKTELSNQKPISDSQVKPEDTPAISPPKVSGPFQSKCEESPVKCVILSEVDPKDVDKLFFCQVCNYSDPTVRGIWSHQRARHGITQRNSEEIHLHTAAIRSRSKTSAVPISPQKIAHDTLAGIPSSFSSPQPEMFYCHLCDYYNPTMKGIIGHLNSQHFGHAVTTVEILMYSDKVNKEKAQHKAMASASSSDLNTSNWPEADSPSAKRENDTTCLTNLSTPGADLLFCQECHFGSPSLRGVLIHQSQKHSKIKRSADQILRCTSMIRRQIKESPASPTKNLALTSTGLPLPIIEKGEEEMLFCHLCNFKHTMGRMKEHYKILHPEAIITHEEIASYSLGVHERTRISASSSNSNASNWGEADGPESKHENDAIYSMTPGLFFCQKCNYGHPVLRSVLAHQTRRHKNINTSTDEIVRYTTMIHRQIKELKSQTKNLALTSTGLPLPIIEGGDEEMLFCHVCNFSHHLLTHITHHLKKAHPDVRTTDEEIVSYSLGVHKQMERISQMGMSAEQVGKCTSIEHGGNEETHTASFPSSASKMAAPTRSLRCHKCSYCFSHLYLLKRHLSKKHKLNITVPQILSQAFIDGSLPAGYHCEWCAFSHKTAVNVYRHCQTKHTLKNVSLKHIAMRLYAGPTVSSLKKTSFFEKKKLSQQPGKNEMKIYPCRACSFKGSSLESISSHFREVHPWTIKEDGLVVDAHAHESDMPTGLPSQETSFQCSFCPAVFDKSHGLHTHLGKKHPEYQTPLSEDEKEDELDSNECTGGLQVYKCPRCAYVNTHCRSVLTHCQMRHTTFKVSADILQTTKVQFPNLKECVPRKKTNNSKSLQQLRGYMCRICPVTRGSIEQLKIHYDQDHNQTAPNLLKPAPKQSTVIKNQLLSKYRSMQSSAMQATSFKDKMPGGWKCNLCKHVACTKKGLTRHLNFHRKYKYEAGNTAYYTCTLCPYSTQVQQNLGKHYKRNHGIPAFLTYYAKVYHIRNYKVTPTTLTRGSSTHAMDNGKRYKCQLCAYSGVHLRYLRSHYANVHGHAALNEYLPPLNEEQQATQCREAEDGKAPEAQSEANAPVQCKKCNRTFRLSEFLAVHFTHFHREDFRMDFTMLNSKSCTNLEGKWYQCGRCGLKIRGTKKLCSHLDDHRRLCMEKAIAVEMTTPVDRRKQPTQPLKVKMQEELQEFETIEDLEKWNVTKVETFTLAASPPPLSSPTPSPSSASKTEEQQSRTRGTEPYYCNECGRTFMSLGGLRVHENSHGTMSDLQRVDTLPNSESFNSFDKYISKKGREGTLKPFYCDLCPYRTSHLSLARSHLLKKHKEIGSGFDVTVNQAETKPAEEEPCPPVDLQEDNCWSEPLDEPEFTEKQVYSEPAEVQRQLGHYNLKRQASVSAPDPVPQDTSPPEDGLLCCEFCNFTSGHMSSIRRHYLNRHNGKRLLKCKDCSFFTGSRKTLEKHIELGHSNCPSEPTHQKDLRCPLCLYQSKNKNNMIDHVMLHREERVIPIEVRRSKLSRYLEGIVFRCHKCTFTSSSDENLRLHALKHDDLKPYKCRLCYFDCTLLSDLEAHLCDKHQVVRNHELVGQINVDLLEARALKKEGQEKKAVEDATKQCNREDRPELNSAVHQRHEQEKKDTTKGVGTEHMDLNTRAPQKGGIGEEDETCHGEEEFDDKSPDGPFLSCEEEEEEGETDEELVDAYEELPILDKKCQEDEMYQHGGQGRVLQKDKGSGSPEHAQQERLNDSIHSEHSYALPEQEGEEKDEDPALDGDDSTGDVVCGVVMEEAFVCTLCGRYLTSGAELERHVVQHGL